jgi:hypothetical protein
LGRFGAITRNGTTVSDTQYILTIVKFSTPIPISGVKRSRISYKINGRTATSHKKPPDVPLDCHGSTTEIHDELTSRSDPRQPPTNGYRMRHAGRSCCEAKRRLVVPGSSLLARVIGPQDLVSLATSLGSVVVALSKKERKPQLQKWRT